MMTKQEIVDSLERNAKENGYYLCPDAQLFNDLIDGLATNTTHMDMDPLVVLPVV